MKNIKEHLVEHGRLRKEFYDLLDDGLDSQLWVRLMSQLWSPIGDEICLRLDSQLNMGI